MADCLLQRNNGNLRIDNNTSVEDCTVGILLSTDDYFELIEQQSVDVSDLTEQINTSITVDVIAYFFIIFWLAALKGTNT